METVFFGVKTVVEHRIRVERANEYDSLVSIVEDLLYILMRATTLCPVYEAYGVADIDCELIDLLSLLRNRSFTFSQMQTLVTSVLKDRNTALTNLYMNAQRKSWGM